VWSLRVVDMLVLVHSESVDFCVDRGDHLIHQAERRLG
jgi:hypothetical protein